MDPLTLALYGGTISALLALLTVAYWQTQRTYPGFGWWVLSLVAFAAAPGSVALRDLLPGSVTDYGPAVFGMLSVLSVLAGQNSFFQTKGVTAWAAATAVLTVTTMVVLEILALPNVRGAAGAAAVGLMALTAARRFVVLAPPGYRSAPWFCATVMALLGVTRCWRAWYFLEAGPGYDVLAGSVASAINFSVNAIFATLWAFAFVVLNASRLERELEESRGELRVLSRIDPLTHLLNRRAFFEEAESALRNARRYQRPISLLILDIDHFKQVNDRFGHPTGDRMLETVAGVLAREVRSTDIVARIGGEEFALLLTETTSAGAWDTAERIRLAIANLVPEHGPDLLAATVSIGMASTPDGATTLEELIRRGDIALYEAKHGGRNQTVAGS